MKFRRIIFVCVGIITTTGWLSIVRAQSEALADRPYRPSASVLKGASGALADPSEEVVARAIRFLGDVKNTEKAGEIVKFLSPAAPASARMGALEYFAKIGPQAAPLIPEVLKLASDPDPNIRAAVLAAVFAANASAGNLDAIVPLLKDTRSDVRAAAATCLEQAGKASAPHQAALLDALNASGNAELRAAILRALVPIGGFALSDAAKFLPLIQDRDPDTRIAAWALVLSIRATAKAGGAPADEQWEASRKQLTSLFEKEPPEIKAAIIELAGKDSATVEASMPVLIQQIKADSPEVVAAALRVLGKVGEHATPYLPLILEKAKDKDSVIRAGAIAALASIGAPATKPNVTVIGNALLDPSELVRSEALLALATTGDALRNMPFKMRDVFPGASESVRATLVKATPLIVRGIGMDDEITARGRAALTDARTEMRISMAYVMAQLGARDGKPLLPDLVALVKDPEASVRGAATVALRAFGDTPEAKAQLRGQLLPLLKDKDSQVRWAALDTFHELEPGQDAAVVEAIAALLKDEDQSVRMAAARTLGAAGAAAKPHLLEVIRLFNDDPAVPPYAAAQTVAEMSPLSAQEIVSVLYPMYVYSDLQPMVRLTAYGASGGERDAQMLIRLLGRSPSKTRDVVPAAETERAVALLQDALNAPLIHEKLKAEIEGRLMDLKAAK